MHVPTAVLLAAGTGSRLRGVAGDRPKCLVEVGGETLLGRSLERLRSVGVEGLVVVVGYGSGLLRAALADLWPEAALVESRQHATTGSMRSLALAVDRIAGRAALVLESDLLYERRALDEVLAAGPDTVLISGPTDAGDEVWVCGGPDGTVREISKRPRGAWPRQGELVGISLLGAGTLARMAATHRRAGEGADLEHYEERVAEVAEERGVRWHRVDDLVWTEIDTPEHLARAEAAVLPALNRGEERKGART